jgi:long-chain acyl-CoA synthetase
MPKQSNAVALISDAGHYLTYRDLHQAIERSRAVFDCDRKALIAIFADRDLGSTLAYLTALSQGHACGFFGALPASAREALVRAYQPEFVVRPEGEEQAEGEGHAGYQAVGALPGGAVVERRRAGCDGEIGADLALLLATSGSTGGPQVVRLSRANLEANARAIVEALGIGAGDRAITSLPLSHCYGLSVLNSHLLAGASVVISPHRVLGTGFWREVARHAVTAFAGVPLVYQTLRERSFDPSRFPSLTTMTQSGGPLGADLVRHYGKLMEQRGGRFWVMYGQTEATARITVLPPRDWRTRPASVGLVVPGGRLWVAGDDGSVLADGQRGAVMYSGPSVMLGYAQSRADLAAGDVMSGGLSTGDLGHLDEGYLHLSGRVKRLVKVLGYRVELDQIEREFAAAGPAAAVRGAAETIVVFVERRRTEHEEIRRDLLARLGLPPAALTTREIGEIPVTRAGKPDYQALAGRWA